MPSEYNDTTAAACTAFDTQQRERSVLCSVVDGGDECRDEFHGGWTNEMILLITSCDSWVGAIIDY